MQKNVPLVQQNVIKLEVFILGRISRERRDGGEGEERGLRKGAERIEIERTEINSFRRH